MGPLRSRSNIFDLEYGELRGYINESFYTYINSNMIGEGLIWTGSKLTGGAYINCFMFGAEYTTGITQSVWTKLNVETTEGFSRDGFVHTDNRITNTDGLRVCKLEAIVSLSSGNNNEIHLAFYKNGDTIIPCSEQEVITSSGGRLSALPIQCLVELDEDDFVEVWVKNESSSTDVDTDNYNFIVTEL